MAFNVRALSPDRIDWPFLGRHFDALPERFRPAVGLAYVEKRKPPPGDWRTSETQRIANTWLREEVAPRIKRGSVRLADSDAEICSAAERCAADCAGFLAALVVSSRDGLSRQITDYMQRQGVPAPDCELPGLIARATAPAWWRRQLRKAAGRSVEQMARELGLVHRRAGLYASDETVARHQEQGRRNAATLEGTIAENELGQAYTLAELAALGLANPDVRRADLMVRIRGFEEWAKARGDVGVFVTWTAPSSYHARLSASGERNPKYREGVTPRQAQALIGAQWAKARAKLQRAGVVPYGFRVVEPHHDGTPHWHMLFFVHRTNRKCLMDTLSAYAWEPERHELTTEAARRARFEWKPIDWRRGTAAGYIAKYIAKNINGQKAAGESIGEDFEGGDATETAARVRAWASCWGIRQFQPIGGPGVTVWRELRRLRATDDGAVPAQVAEQGELFTDAWSAADRGDWEGFTKAQGGIEIARKDRPIQLWRETPDRMNAYWEEPAPVVRGVAYYGAAVETRVHTWEIRRAYGAGANLHVERGASAGLSGKKEAAPGVDGGVAPGSSYANRNGETKYWNKRNAPGEVMANGPNRNGWRSPVSDRLLGGLPAAEEVAELRMLRALRPESLALPAMAEIAARHGFGVGSGAQPPAPWTRVNNCTGGVDVSAGVGVVVPVVVGEAGISGGAGPVFRGEGGEARGAPPTQ